MKKIIFVLLITLLCSTSVAFGYVIGGSNLSLGMYPAFNAYLSYNPSRSEVERYIQESKRYVENCNNDIDRIQEAKNDAIRKVNYEVDKYNRGY